MKRTRLILFFLFALAFLKTPSAQALDTSYAVMPGEGSSTQPILIWVRVDPLIDTQKMYLYVFWDNIPLKVRMPDITIGKTVNHEHRWDITVTPPASQNYLGKHHIKIWIETASGDKKELDWQYKITSGLPPVEWWEKLPQALLDEIRGPPGLQGDTGLRGLEGDQGATGRDGAVGPIGTQGLQGLHGVNGTLGEQGPIGESPNFVPTIVGACVLTGVASFVASFYLLKREQQ